jgi:hypothetical protein
MAEGVRPGMSGCGAVARSSMVRGQRSALASTRAPILYTWNALQRGELLSSTHWLWGTSGG